MSVRFCLLCGLEGCLLACLLLLARKLFYRCAHDSLATLDAHLIGDEDARLRAASASTFRLLLSSLASLVVLLAVLFVSLFPVAWMYVSETGRSGFSFLLDLSFLVFFSLGAALPFTVRSCTGRKTGYSELSRLLHRIFLDHYRVSRKLFDLDLKLRRKKGIPPRADYVVVTGLARAGTTSFVTALYECGGFASLDYSNMPLVLSPNLWRRLYRPRRSGKRERAHADGLSIGLDSVEALDEFFFKAHLEDAYIEPDVLLEHEIPREVHERYLLYQALIRRREEDRYLTKNNNFMLRYRSMREWNPSFRAMVLFREPLAHAHSLLAQHRRFVELQERTPFVLEYMNWLGHHEFGRDHRRFRFEKDDPPGGADPACLDYWLQAWIRYHRHLLRVSRENLYLIHHGQWCRSPGEVLENILSQIGWEGGLLPALEPYENRRETSESFDGEQYRNAQAVYRELLFLSEKTTGLPGRKEAEGGE